MRIQIYNQDLDMICGVPLKTAIKPNLITVIKMDSGTMGFFPMNAENKRDMFSNLARVQLRYHFDRFLDFKDTNQALSLLE